MHNGSRITVYPTTTRAPPPRSARQACPSGWRRVSPRGASVDKPKPKAPVQPGRARSSGAFAPGAGSRMKRAGDGKYDIGSMGPPLERGAIVDGFLLEKRLHQGGMASMWR